MSNASRRREMGEPPELPLPPDAADFDLFKVACPARELVRIRYLQRLPDDPDLPEEIRERGLETIVEAHAISIDEKGITFTPTVLEPESENAEAMQKIAERFVARKRVLEIRRIGEGTPVVEHRR